MTKPVFSNLPELMSNPFKGDNFFVAKKPIKVFKKLDGDNIANLIIPKGAAVWTDADYSDMGYPHGKSRASMVLCHSIVKPLVSHGSKSVRNGTAHYVPVDSSGGYYKSSFIYHANKKISEFYLGNHDVLGINTLKQMAKVKETGVVVPDEFSAENNQCRAGIHFFFNLNEALNYQG